MWSLLLFLENVHFVILANAGSTDYVDKIKLVVDYFRQNKGERILKKAAFS